MNRHRHIAQMMRAAAAPPEDIITEGLIARWKLDGNLLDSVGGNHGTFRGTGMAQEPDGVTFSGFSSGVTFGNQDWYDGADRQFSITTKTVIDAYGNYKFFAQNTDSACSEDNRQFYWDTLGGARMRFAYTSALTAGNIVDLRTANDAWVVGEPINACLTYDGTIYTNSGYDRVKLYINGSAVTISGYSSTGPLSDMKQGTALSGIVSNFKSTGAACFVAGNPTVGKTSDVRVYNRVLTPAEAISITNGTG